jgi:UDP-N-acetylmuramate--alanine ligase
MSQGSLHFVGIGGIGMSAIARVLLARGETITGSDVAESPIIAELRLQGVPVTIGHAAANVNGARALVVSSAIDMQNPECSHAAARHIPIVPRGEMLRRIMEGRRGIAICGTHGKTTTTAMTAAVLRGCGIDAGLVLGGVDVATGTNAHEGSAPWFLTEADESDGSFALLDPEIAVVTNVENDHLVSDADLPALVSSFAAFLGKIPENGTVIAGADNADSRALASIARRARTRMYGFAPDAHVSAHNVRFDGLGSSFDVIAGGVCLGNVQLRVPGAINVENALGAISVGCVMDLPFAQIAAALRQFCGVRRRFEVLAAVPRMTVIDDYAHHPTAVRATIAAARQYHPAARVVVAFQPHRYTRTAHLAEEFAAALSGADAVYLAPIYGAGEVPIDGISERDIGEPLAQIGTPVRYVKYVHDLRGLLQRDVPAGALVLLLGAGNISKVAEEIAKDVLSR